MSQSKISHFPTHVREELNNRLDNGHKTKPLLAWLNSLPEVKAVLDQHFESEPVKRQNLDAWKTPGFRNWQLLRSAINFSQETLPDDLDESMLQKMGVKLIRFIQLRYAALAAALPAPQADPEAELRRLAALCNNLTALRRGDLSATRLAIEQQRLAMEQADADDQKEAEFWQWTRRPEIQEKLYPHRDPDQERRDVDRLITERMLGIRVPQENETPLDPACFI